MQGELQQKRVVAEHFTGKSREWREIYDQNSEDEISFYKELHIKRKESALRILTTFANGRALNVLDIGCGPGILMKDVLQRGHQATGLDIAETMIREAEETLHDYIPHRARCVVGDAENLPFQDGSFDAVLCIGVLQFLPKTAKSISEISRILKEGGVAIISLPNILQINYFFDPFYYLVRGIAYLRHKLTPGRKDAVAAADISTNEGFINKRYTYGSARKIFSPFNVPVSAVQCIGFGPFTFWKKEILPSGVSSRISSRLESASAHRAGSILRYFSDQWVMSFTKQQESKLAY
jgi:ubiquinone/menaquinone biosynthesis C-methylase UbiE